MVYLYGLSNISCEWNQQLQAVMVYVSQVKQAIICRAQKELGSLLMLVLLSSELSYKLKTWLHQGWFVVLAHSEICWSIPSSSGTHSCIFMVYSDGAESRRRGVIKMSMKVNPTWSCMLTPPKPVSNHVHDLDLRMVLRDVLWKPQ